MDIGACSYNGLNFGAGSNVHVTGIQGWDDMPAAVLSDAQRAQDQGEFIGIDYLGGRDITLDLAMIAADHPSFVTLLETVRTAFSFTASNVEPTLQLFNNAFQVGARVRKRDMPYDAGQFPRYGLATVLLHATDPRYYSSTLQSQSASLPVANGGAAWPWVWPISWGSSSGSGTFVANNAGNFESRPIVTIVGPVDNPTVANLTTGLSMTFAITLASTDTLVIDMRQRTVILDGTASRRNTVVSGSSWWTLPPGNSTIAYNANTLDVGSLMTLSWRSAWL